MKRLDAAEDLAAVYAAVIETAIDSVIVTDESGIVVALNPAAVATFGHTPGQAIGRDIGALLVPDHMRAAHRAGMERYQRTGAPHVLGRRVEMEAMHRDGHLIPVELAITEVRLPSARHFTANLRDLRPARAAAAEIERQREALSQSERLSAIGSLLAGVAHELNNPLTIAMGEAALLVGDLEAEPRHQKLTDRARRIHDATGRCAKVVRSFLSIVRRRQPERQSVDMGRIIDASIDLLAHGLRTSGIEVTRHIPEELPAAWADPDQLQQIVVNLIVNATQALDLAPMPRRMCLSATVEAGEMVLACSDNGPGVPPDLAERIFEPFFSTKPEGVGTGIGLAVSRDLARSQGGELSLMPIGPGARFELRLPLASVEPALPTTAVVETRPLRVLIVDDEAGIAGVLAAGLAQAGHECSTASGGRDAQERLKNGTFDVVVCDLRMPDLDGPALHAWMLDACPGMARRTIFMTGDALGHSARRFLAESGRPVIEKPFTPSDLVQLLARHI